jgi:hypothetical protein
MLAGRDAVIDRPMRHANPTISTAIINDEVFCLAFPVSKQALATEQKAVIS